MRRYLLVVIAAGLVAALAGGGPTLAAQGPIKIGLVTATTGGFSPNGRDMINGFELALKEAGNKAAGRQIQMLIEDDQGLPGPTLTKARKLVELDKVDLMTGPLAASSGYVLRDYVDQQKIPSLFPVVSSDDLTQRKTSPWIIRTGWTSSQPNHAFGEYAAKTLHYKRIATIASSVAEMVSRPTGVSLSIAQRSMSACGISFGTSFRAVSGTSPRETSQRPVCASEMRTSQLPPSRARRDNATIAPNAIR